MPDRLLLVLLLLCCHYAAHSQELLRKAWWGASVAAVSDNDSLVQERQQREGLWVSQVRGGTSEALGVTPDDILLTLNDEPVRTLAEFERIWSRIEVDQPIILRIDRDGKQILLTGKTMARPYETDSYGEVLYDQVAFRGGQLRVIINKPQEEGPRPAVLFIPGYTCSSVDNLSDSNPYGRVIRAFSKAGYVVLRVEKSGIGDSQNTPACDSIDLYDEIDSFAQGLKKLRALPYVDTTNIFIFGHSMGGIIAPALGARYPIKGAIVYGTTMKSWFEYQLEMCRIQELLAHPSPSAYERTCRLSAQLNYDFYINKKALVEIAQDPVLDSLLRNSWQYDGQGHIFGRNAAYWRQIQDLDLHDYWKNTRAQVLVLYGEADFQAFSKADHEQIAYTVNYYRPNTARVIAFPETDHFMAKIGSRQVAYDTYVRGEYQKLFNHFNTDITQQIIAWANKISKQPNHQ